ncbi:hypothetical protein G6L37_07470 [Agrobacterium rubi]|nr:hypothetical protein [Agrobacterium rubi]NTF25207.1 hypothetical protein [Agrobacterium rubi]
MRLSYRTHLLRTESGLIYGIYSEADFCAEHEDGLGRLYRDMGCGDASIEGIERYQPSATAVELGHFPFLGKNKFWFRDDEDKKKWVTRATFSSRENASMPDGGYIPSSSRDATVYFSENGFLVVSRSDEVDAFLKVLTDHALKRDIAVFMGGFGNSNPFNRGGLVIVIPSLASAEDKETLRAAHENTRLLEVAATRTGIRERVAAKVAATKGASGWAYNSPYNLYAISPSWSETIKSRGDGDILKTAHDVIFFLNNGRGIHGWYTVEELDEWLDGHGKVLEDEKARQKPAA